VKPWRSSAGSLAMLVRTSPQLADRTAGCGCADGVGRGCVEPADGAQLSCACLDLSRASRVSVGCQQKRNVEQTRPDAPADKTCPHAFGQQIRDGGRRVLGSGPQGQDMRLAASFASLGRLAALRAGDRAVRFSTLDALPLGQRRPGRSRHDVHSTGKYRYLRGVFLDFTTRLGQAVGPDDAVPPRSQ
jgi:hypothetical protein